MPGNLLMSSSSLSPRPRSAAEGRRLTFARGYCAQGQEAVLEVGDSPEQDEFGSGVGRSLHYVDGVLKRLGGVHDDLIGRREAEQATDLRKRGGRRERRAHRAALDVQKRIRQSSPRAFETGRFEQVAVLRFVKARVPYVASVHATRSE